MGAAGPRPWIRWYFFGGPGNWEARPSAKRPPNGVSAVGSLTFQGLVLQILHVERVAGCEDWPFYLVPRPEPFTEWPPAENG